MKYGNPVTCVWEITMGCNMRCKHCGSSCAGPLPGELTTQEAFGFIDMCADMQMKWISISGGEPFTRPDLIEVVKYARKKGILINIITNGWLINEKHAQELGELNGIRVGISLDGPKEVHDFIRKPGSFERAMKSFDVLNSHSVETGCITTITKKNIDRLDEMKKILIDKKVECWQVQIGFPMGNLGKRCDWVIEPHEINKIIDFCYDTSCEGKIDIYPADCVGYYNDKETEVYKKSFNTDEIPEWEGCHAGKYVFGILHNGDILGCTSIRNKEFIEGNIKERTLREIWEDSKSFSWNRNFTKNDLKGNCLKCKHAEKCLGGCANSRLSMNGSIYSDNLYCTHNLLMKAQNCDNQK